MYMEICNTVDMFYRMIYHLCITILYSVLWCWHILCCNVCILCAVMFAYSVLRCLHILCCNVCIFCAAMFAYSVLRCLHILCCDVCIFCAAMFAYSVLQCLHIVCCDVCIFCAAMFAYSVLQCLHILCCNVCMLVYSYICMDHSGNIPGANIIWKNEIPFNGSIFADDVPPNTTTLFLMFTLAYLE